MDNVTNEESLSFWGGPLIDPSQPFNSRRRYQLLLQLKKQFSINPLEWTYKASSGEGHWLPIRAGNKDRVENESGNITNKNSGKIVYFWFDWISKCQEESDERYNQCGHSSPEECEINFYIDLFDEDWYDPEGNKVEKPFRHRREKQIKPLM